MKDQRKNTFRASSLHIFIKEEHFIKPENTSFAVGFDTLQLTEPYQDNAPNTTKNYPFWEQQPEDLYRENYEDFESYTFYNRNNYHPCNQNNPYRVNQKPALQFQSRSQYIPQPNWQRESVTKQYPVKKKTHAIVMVCNLHA